MEMCFVNGEERGRGGVEQGVICTSQRGNGRMRELRVLMGNKSYLLYLPSIQLRWWNHLCFSARNGFLFLPQVGWDEADAFQQNL